MKTYTGQITTLPENGIFVFGANTQGRHGKGAALIAKTKFGAIYGQPQGMQGKSYAIVTKDLTKTRHPSVTVESILTQIAKLYSVAHFNPLKDFFVAYSADGTNLNGFTNIQMALMFAKHIIPENIVFEVKFAQLIQTYLDGLAGKRLTDSLGSIGLGSTGPDFAWETPRELPKAPPRHGDVRMVTVQIPMRFEFSDKIVVDHGYDAYDNMEEGESFVEYTSGLIMKFTDTTPIVFNNQPNIHLYVTAEETKRL